MSKSSRPNGVILYRGPSLLDGSPIVCIATFETSNEKTGDMIQTWILPDNGLDPVEALKQNANFGACGNCPLQGWMDPDTGKMINRVCYVNVGQAPLGIWRSFQRGGYPKYDARKHRQWFVGRKVRIGAYGDPAAIPVPLVRWLADVSIAWTGYSHQLFWCDPRRAEALAKYLMVSCHTRAQSTEATRRGWRFFEAIREDQAPPEDAIECPHYSHGVQCADCLLCEGTDKRAKSIYVIAHAKVGRNLGAVQEMEAMAV